jgi:hypothetical protein
VVLVAAVEPVGDAAQVGLVLLDVGVEQQQGTRPTAARHTRRLSVARPASSPTPAPAPGVVGEQVQRQALRVEDGVGLDLPAVERERLAEVAER